MLGRAADQWEEPLNAMAISFPITLPTAQGFTRVTIGPRSAVAMFASPTTGQQQIFQHPMQMLTATIELPPMKRDTASVFLAALLSLQGTRGTFIFGDPAYTTPRGIGTGTPLVAGAGQTGTTLLTDGWTVSQTGIMLAGDWVQIGSGSTRQLCMVLVNANSDGAGAATLELFPRIRTAFADNTALTVSSPQGVWRLAEESSFVQDLGGITRGVVINAMEAY
jgi:hypothetical protein